MFFSKGILIQNHSKDILTCALNQRIINFFIEEVIKQKWSIFESSDFERVWIGK